MWPLLGCCSLPAPVLLALQPGFRPDLPLRAIAPRRPQSELVEEAMSNPAPEDNLAAIILAHFVE